MLTSCRMSVRLLRLRPLENLQRSSRGRLPVLMACSFIQAQGGKRMMGRRRSISAPTERGRNIRRTIINLAVTASIVAPLALVSTAPSASAYDGQRQVPCEGFDGVGGPLCFVTGAAGG